MHSSKRGRRRHIGSEFRLQFKSSQGVCSELILTENNFLQKGAPWLGPDCAEINSGIGSHEWETRVGMAWQAGPALPIADVLILHFIF